MSPKVTVIVPNFNHALYLEKRIESILIQTFQDYEVILMDDCSSDGSMDVINKYRGHPKVSEIVKNTINSGSTFKQWNKGIRKAKGEYIWIAESDDYADERFLEITVSQLENNPYSGLVFCQSYMIDQDSNNLGKLTDIMIMENSNLTWNKDFSLLEKDIIADLFLEYNFILNASSVLFRKDVYLNVGGADESYTLGGDWLTWSKIGVASNIHYTCTPLNYYRFHTNNVRSRTKNTQYYEFFRIILFIYKVKGLSGWVKERAIQRMMFFWRKSILHKEEIGKEKIKKLNRHVFLLKCKIKLDIYKHKYLKGNRT